MVVPSLRQKALRSRSQGFEIWRGKSPEDGAPIVCLAWGFIRKSANEKTGPMIQFAIIRADMSPAEAAKRGLTASICNHCPLQAWLARLIEEVTGQKSLERCYVGTHQGINESYKSWTRGNYPKIKAKELRRLLCGRRARMGSYGNFSNMPLRYVDLIARASDAWTLYEHNWELDHVQPMRAYAMASVQTLEDKIRANALGWRTFRITRVDDIQPDEIICPASEAGGKRVNCFQCRLCCGTERGAKNIVIPDHGPTSASSQARRMAARAAKQQARKDAKRGLIGLPVA